MPQLVRRRRSPAVIVNQTPGLSKSLEDVAKLVLAGRIPTGSSKFKIKPFIAWDRMRYAAAGQAALNFFTQDVGDFTSNLPSPGQLNNDQVMVAKSVHIAFENGIGTDGTKDAPGNEVYTHATATAPILLTEEKRQALISGQFSLKVGDTDYVIDQKDLTHFAWGGGFKLDAALAFNSATTANGISLIASNQSPTGQDLWQFQPWQVILPGKKIKATMKWQSVIAVTTAVVYARVGIKGLLITPANG